MHIMKEFWNMFFLIILVFLVLFFCFFWYWLFVFLVLVFFRFLFVLFHVSAEAALFESSIAGSMAFPQQRLPLDILLNIRDCLSRLFSHTFM